MQAYPNPRLMLQKMPLIRDDKLAKLLITKELYSHLNPTSADYEYVTEEEWRKKNPSARL